MKFPTNVCRQEKGSVLVTTLVLIATLLAALLTMLRIADFEMRMATNDRSQKVAFFGAESGLYAQAKMVRKVVEELEFMSFSSLLSDTSYNAYVSVASTLSDETVLDEQLKTDLDGPLPLYGSTLLELKYRYPANMQIGYDCEMDFAFSHNSYSRGSSLEFASGYEGLMQGTATGGIRTFINMSSVGKGPGNAKFTARGLYRYVSNVPGGL